MELNIGMFTHKQVFRLRKTRSVNLKVKLNSPSLLWICNSYTMVCPTVRGDNPRALASGSSPAQADKPWCNYLYRPQTLLSVEYIVLKFAISDKGGMKKQTNKHNHRYFWCVANVFYHEYFVKKKKKKKNI